MPSSFQHHSGGEGIASKHRRAIHLLIAEESPLACQLLKDSFKRSRSPFNVVHCVVSHHEIINSLKARPCDVALVSDNLADGVLTGFRALRELRHTFPETRPVMLLKSMQEDLVVDAFRTGAKGVYCRTESLKTLSKCITAVHHGQIWANSAQLDSVLNAFVDAAPLQMINPTGRALLTKREEDVVKLVIEGLSNREAGQKLGLTEHTVSNYLFRVYEKLGISSRVELVLYSLKYQHPGASES